MRIRNFTPAITTMSKEVLKIAGEQPAYFRTKQFHNMMLDNEKMLLDLVGCKEGRAIFLTTSGTGAMDAAVCNLIGPKEKVLVINGGTFGERWSEICKFYDLNYKDFKPGFGKNINFDLLEKEFLEFKPSRVLMQRNETSSMQLYNVEGVGRLCSKHNASLIVDEISSFAIDKYHMNDYNVDVTILSSQKGFNLFPGLAMVII